MIDCPGCGRPIKGMRSIGAHSMWFPDCTHEKRFWGRVQKSDGCWMWTGPKNEWGYGLIATPKNQNQRCHRYSWELTNGPIPDGLLVLHKCDVPACVNPEHLFLGTFKDNKEDMVRKGRDMTIGEKAHHTKLKNADVLAIRLDGGKTDPAELAARYGVRRDVIGHILKGRTWKHIRVPQERQPSEG